MVLNATDRSQSVSDSAVAGADGKVTNQQLLAWMQNPVPASQLGSLPAFGCSRPVVDPALKICNGIQQNELGLLANCPFPDFPWVSPTAGRHTDPRRRPATAARSSRRRRPTPSPRRPRLRPAPRFASACRATARRPTSIRSGAQIATAARLTAQQQVHVLGELVRVQRLVSSDRCALRSSASAHVRRPERRRHSPQRRHRLQLVLVASADANAVPGFRRRQPHRPADPRSRRRPRPRPRPLSTQTLILSIRPFTPLQSAPFVCMQRLVRRQRPELGAEVV